MDTRVFCVYNLARGVFLSAKVTVADGVNEPLKILKVLVSGLGLDTETGLWISPLSAIPSVPRLFPFDLLYLDQDQRVVESAGIVPGAEFPRYRREVASALVLARQTVESTQTARGDRLIICIEEEIEHQIAAAGAPHLTPLVANGRSSAGKLQELFDRNGTGEGTAVSTLLEPFSSLVTRVAEDNVPVIGSANALAAAVEPPVNQPANGQAAELEPEEKISAPSGIDTARTEPFAASKTNPTKDSELTKLVLDLKGALAEMARKPIEPAASTSTEETSNHEAKVAIPGEKPVNSIAETIIDRPGSGNRSLVNGQQGGVEDLFSNWVDAPSLSSAWIPRNPRPGTAPTISTTPALGDPTPPDKSSSGVEPDSKASAALDSHQIPKPENAVPDVVSISPDPAIQFEQPKGIAAAPTNATAPARTPIPTGTSIPQAPQATTFTAGSLGMWRISMPTAIGPHATAQSPRQTRPTEPVADKQSSSVNETIAKEKQAPVVKGVDSPAEASANSDESRVARADDFPRESVRTQAAAKVREPAEVAASGQEMTVLPPDATTQGIAASAHQSRAISESTENSRVADKASVAIPKNKPAVELATGSRERLPVKLAQMAERPLKAETAAAVPEKARTSPPEAPAAKAGVAQSPGAARKQGKVESKATVPAKTAAPKSQPKLPIERPHANGKSSTGPPSLGERFKRWLNPVTPIASDRRRAHRRYVPGMVAHYYTGGAPKPHDVADISMTGFYLLTEDRWMPDTMIQMTLQKPCAKGERKQSINVLSKIVRRGSDGVAAEFVMPDGLDPQSRDIQPSQATDRFTLARFI